MIISRKAFSKAIKEAVYKHQEELEFKDMINRRFEAVYQELSELRTRLTEHEMKDYAYGKVPGDDLK